MIANGTRCHSRSDAVAQGGRAPLHNGRSEGQYTSTRELYVSVTVYILTQSFYLKVGSVNTSNTHHTSVELARSTGSMAVSTHAHVASI